MTSLRVCLIYRRDSRRYVTEKGCHSGKSDIHLSLNYIKILNSFIPEIWLFVIDYTSCISSRERRAIFISPRGNLHSQRYNYRAQLTAFGRIESPPIINILWNVRESTERAEKCFRTGRLDYRQQPRFSFPRKRSNKVRYKNICSFRENALYVCRCSHPHSVSPFPVVEILG